jgi:hypothetical protein
MKTLNILKCFLLLPLIPPGNLHKFSRSTTLVKYGDMFASFLRFYPQVLSPQAFQIIEGKGTGRFELKSSSNH